MSESAIWLAYAGSRCIRETWQCRSHPFVKCFPQVLRKHAHTALLRIEPLLANRKFAAVDLRVVVYAFESRSQFVHLLACIWRELDRRAKCRLALFMVRRGLEARAYLSESKNAESQASDYRPVVLHSDG